MKLKDMELGTPRIGLFECLSICGRVIGGCAAWLLCTSVLHADLPLKVEPREWSDISGRFSVTATFVDSNDYDVTLARENGETIKVARRRLADHDKEYVDSVGYAANTLAGAETVNQLLEELMLELAELEQTSGSERDNKTQAVMRHHQIVNDAATQLAALHDESKDAISGFLAGTLFAIGKDARIGAIGQLTPIPTDKRKLRESEKYLDEGLVRLRCIHQHLPGTYPVALASALNNRAVLAVKRSQTSKAATLFSEATQIVEEVPLAASHNAALLLSLSLQKNPLFEISGSQQRALREHVDEPEARDTGPRLPKRFLYSTAYEGSGGQASLPSSGRLHAETLVRLELWPELTCFICSGAGYNSCGGCVNGVISFRQRQQVGVNHLNEPVFGQVVKRHKCQTCNGAGVLKCKHCSHGQISIRD